MKYFLLVDGGIICDVCRILRKEKNAFQEFYFLKF